MAAGPFLRAGCFLLPVDASLVGKKKYGRGEEPCNERSANNTPAPSKHPLHSSCQSHHDAIPLGRQQVCLRVGAAFWTDDNQTLQDIFVAAGLEPLSSEWRHLNDLDARIAAEAASAAGRFEMGTKSFSNSACRSDCAARLVKISRPEISSGLLLCCLQYQSQAIY